MGGLPATSIGSTFSNQIQNYNTTLDTSTVKKAQSVYNEAIQRAATIQPAGDLVGHSVANDYAKMGNMPTIGQKVNRLIGVA